MHHCADEDEADEDKDEADGSTGAPDAFEARAASIALAHPSAVLGGGVSPATRARYASMT